MDRVFSVGEISDPFWSSSSSSTTSVPPNEDPKMNRSSSEWAFQRFLQEAEILPSSSVLPPSPSVRPSDSSRTESDSKVVEIKDASPPPSDIPPNVPIDSEEYQAFLKRRLDMACAAVALTRASAVKPPDSAPLIDNGPQASGTAQLESQAPWKGSGYGLPREQDKAVAGPVGIPALPAMPKKSVVQIRPTTSVSSREQSDEDDFDGETEVTDNMDPADVKRVRR